MAFDFLAGVLELGLEVVASVVGGSVDSRRGRKLRSTEPATDTTYAARPPASKPPPTPKRRRGGTSWTLPKDPLVIRASDATERALVERMHAAPTDDETRMIYGDWLESHGLMAKANFVRGLDRLADVYEVVASTDATWRAITNCQPIVCSSWDCPRRWNALTPVANDAWVRRCPHCSRTTRYVTDLDELRARRASGEQVLLDLATAMVAQSP